MVLIHETNKQFTAGNGSIFGDFWRKFTPQGSA